MLEIHKKILLRDIIDNLATEQRTRTYLKRRISESRDVEESDVEEALNFGLKEGFLVQEARAYIRLADSDAVKEFRVLEEDYYDCIQLALTENYKNFSGKNGQFLVSRTARSHTKIVGRWTRPDFTVVTNRKFPYIKENEFDIITFEAKSPANCDTLAVFEALAHNSAATRSYVIIPISSDEFNDREQASRIKEECGRHGIGLILFSDSYELNKAEIVIEAQRRPLNPEKCSQFLKSVLDQSDLDSLSTW